METELSEAMASGVFVEVRDTRDNTIAQAVFVDWRGRPVPAVGDTMFCEAVTLASGARERLRGLVRSRTFDVQTEADGGTAVWVYVVLERIEAPRTKRPHRCQASFSAN